ncbi:DUF421 domain-containing protein [Cupriavidus basilensis]|uniref:DUF421 domain-containing protein n=1 Tax=Cupriavidus basilensis TaxID=68895 RepID=UPI0007515F20|nr:YetF domain-containing protein [Cupriavidus basilensis]
MWNLSAPWWEFVLRGLIVYGSLLVLLRLSGKRQIGQLTSLDLVLLLVLSNAVQNSMNAGDNSVTAGLILAVTLIGANLLLAWLSWRSRRFENVVEGRPQVLIHEGQIYPDVMKNALISRDDLHKALRHAGCERVADVHFAILENDGTISVMVRKDAPATPRDAATSLWRAPINNDSDAPI